MLFVIREIPIIIANFNFSELCNPQALGIYHFSSAPSAIKHPTTTQLTVQLTFPHSSIM